MKRLLMIAASIALVAAVGVGYAGAQDYGGGHHKGQSQGKKSHRFKGLRESQSSLSAYLTGKAEVNDEGEDGAGDPNAKGTASFLVADERTLCYGFAIRGADEPAAVHIHKGIAGKNGDIVISFDNPPKDAEGQPAGDPGASSGCKVLEEESELAALRRILSNPKGYYVNIHTASFPDGAVRGQLSRMLYDND
jgi:CHRD domain